jgi:phosphatidylglycerol:prolipoprotein diacylglycerol transferase
MNPVFWKIGNFTIHWYGVMMSLALLSAVVVWHTLGKRARKYPGFGTDVGVWLMVSGLIGARAAFVIANYNTVYRYNLAEIVRIDQGGLIYYGGVVGSCIGMYLFAMWKHEPRAQLADLVVAPIPLAHALGRVGCFLNGCCYGREYNGLLHVHMHGTDLHAVQLYEAGLNSLLFVGLLYLYGRRSSAGQVFAAYLITYGIIRYIVEFFRGDERAMLGAMTTAQGVSLVLVVAGVALMAKTLLRPIPMEVVEADAE